MKIEGFPSKPGFLTPLEKLECHLTGTESYQSMSPLEFGATLSSGAFGFFASPSGLAMTLVLPDPSGRLWAPWSGKDGSCGGAAEATAQHGSPLIPGLPINVQLLFSSLTILHNSHESGLIYSQEIQTFDMTSEGLCICMK